MPVTVISGIHQSLSLPIHNMSEVKSNNFDFLTLLKISIRSNNFNIQENLNRNILCHWLQYGSSLLLYCSWYSLSLFSGIFKKYYCAYKKTYIIYFWKLSVIFPGFCPFIFYLPSSQFLIQPFSVFLLQQSNSSFGPFSFYRAFPLTYVLTLLPHFILQKSVLSMVH